MKYKVGDCFITIFGYIRIIEHIEPYGGPLKYYRYRSKGSFYVWYEHEIDNWIKLPDSVGILLS